MMTGLEGGLYQGNKSIFAEVKHLTMRHTAMRRLLPFAEREFAASFVKVRNCYTAWPNNAARYMAIASLVELMEVNFWEDAVPHLPRWVGGELPAGWVFANYAKIFPVIENKPPNLVWVPWLDKIEEPIAVLVDWGQVSLSIGSVEATEAEPSGLPEAAAQQSSTFLSVQYTLRIA